MSQLDIYMVRRLLATGQIKPGDEPTQANFDRAYEADIMAIVMRVVNDQGLTP